MSGQREDADVEPWDTSELPVDLRRAFNAYKTLEPNGKARAALFDSLSGVPHASARVDLLWRGALYVVAVTIVAGAALWWFAREPPRAIEHDAPRVVTDAVETLPSPKPAPPLVAPAQEPAQEPAPVVRPEVTRGKRALDKPAAVPLEDAGADSARELALLVRAKKSMSRDPRLALSLADEHRTRFPRGAFREEREVIAIEALQRAGMADLARQRAAAFRAGFPQSTHLDRLDVVLYPN